MIKQNQRILNNLNILTDGLLLLCSMILAYGVRFLIFEMEAVHIGFPFYMRLSLVVVPFFLILYGGFGLYGSFRNSTFLSEFALLMRASIIGILVLLAGLFVFKWIHLSRWVLVLFFCLTILTVGAKRFALRIFLRRYRKKGFNIKHVVIVGSGAIALEYARKIVADKSLGYLITGYICGTQDLLKKNMQSAEAALPFPLLGTLRQLDTVLEKRKSDEVVAALEPAEYTLLPRVIETCEKNGSKLSVVPFYFQYLPSHPFMDEVDGLPLINIRHIPLDLFVNGFCKRSMDLIGSAALIILTSPIMLITAIGIRLTSPGPIIFRQERVGLNKKSFTMYKFRSMRINDDSDLEWTTDEDPRKTKFGAFIRKFSIDELPQFFNVLLGDMSLVGPRPEIPHFVDQFKESVPLYMVRHQVRPGITGWAQINGYRGNTSIAARIEHDIYYIENWSLLFDCKILFTTLFKGFVNSEKLK